MDHESLEHALEYTARGVRVTPTHGMVRSPRRTWFRPGRRNCDCGSDCGHPGGHPLPGAVSTVDSPLLREQWAAFPSANVMISPSGVIDIWAVPREIGALAMRVMETQRHSVWPPVLRFGNDCWIFCTMPLEGLAPRIAAHGTEVRRFDTDELLLVPPSRTPGGRIQWEWSQAFPWGPIPDPEPVLSALVEAAARLHPWEIRDDASAAAGGTPNVGS